MSQIPIVIESHTRSERAYDIYSRLLSDRIIVLGEAVTDATAGAVIAQLMFLESTDPNEDIFVYINSPGGSITAGFAIFDMMQHIQPDVSTICLGMAASMSSLLLAGGTKGKRFSFPNSEILLHQPMVSGSIQGTAADIQIHSRWLNKTKQKIIRLYSDQTGQAAEKIAKDIERDYFMTAEEAKQYGIVDNIITAGK